MFQVQMRPEWNPARLVDVDGRVIMAAASPYDFPAAFVWEEDGSRVIATLMYDFPEREGVAIAFSSPHVRLFRGEKTGRVLRVEIDAANAKEALNALTETAEALRQLASDSRRAKKPLRDAVHLGALEQAFPHMGPVIEQRLNELRSEQSGEW